MPTLTTVIALEALGYACTDNGLIFSLNAQMWACETPILHFGTEEQKQRYLPGLCDGSLLAAHGMSEPGSGSDAFALATTAEDGGGYVLNGTKTFVTNAPEADLFVVFATIDRTLGFAGITAFLVERDTPGPLGRAAALEDGPAHVADERGVPRGLRGRRERCSASPAAGWRSSTRRWTWERSCILASTVGAMERQLERSIAYAQEREQFGSPIGSFQAVAHLLVDMKLRLETARLLLYRLGWLLDSGKPADARLGARQALPERQLRALEPRRAPGARRLRLHDRVRARARGPRRDRQPALLGDVRDPVQHRRASMGL